MILQIKSPKDLDAKSSWEEVDVTYTCYSGLYFKYFLPLRIMRKENKYILIERQKIQCPRIL